MIGFEPISVQNGGDVRVMQLRVIAGRDWDRLLSAAPR
jgi:hypothetical protein